MKHSIRYLSFAISLVFLSSCGAEEGPLTASEAYRRMSQLGTGLPVYEISVNPAFSEFKSAYYYVDEQDNSWLLTYLIDEASQKTVAKMRVSSIRMGSIGDASSKEVTIAAADNNIGSTCIPDPFYFANDATPHESYQTCVRWRVKGKEVVLYSSLPVSTSLELINSFEEFK